MIEVRAPGDGAVVNVDGGKEERPRLPPGKGERHRVNALLLAARLQAKDSKAPVGVRGQGIEEAAWQSKALVESGKVGRRRHEARLVAPDVEDLELGQRCEVVAREPSLGSHDCVRERLREL